jgi:hypothetical protein
MRIILTTGCTTALLVIGFTGAQASESACSPREPVALSERAGSLWSEVPTLIKPLRLGRCG